MCNELREDREIKSLPEDINSLIAAIESKLSPVMLSRLREESSDRAVGSCEVVQRLRDIKIRLQNLLEEIAI